MAVETLGVARAPGASPLVARKRRPADTAWQGGRPPGRLRPRRTRPLDAAPGEQTPVGVSRATVIDTRALDDDAAATQWFERLDLATAALASLAVLNRLIEAHRIATADPYVHQLPPSAAVAVRGGFGYGDQVAAGSWTRAVELPAAGPGGRAGAGSGASASLRPAERMTALLAARERPLACEELTLRARLDLDFQRTAAAALGTRLALEAALVELGADARATGLEPRLLELRDLRDDVVAAANASLVGPQTAAQRDTVALALQRLEALLRARTARRFAP